MLAIKGRLIDVRISPYPRSCYMCPDLIPANEYCFVVTSPDSTDDIHRTCFQAYLDKHFNSTGTQPMKWVSKKCPVCLGLFDYVEGSYEPSTCNKFDCLHKYLHDPRYKGR